MSIGLKPPSEFMIFRRLWKKIRSRLVSLSCNPDSEEAWIIEKEAWIIEREPVPDEISELIKYYDRRCVASCYAFDPIITSVPASAVDRTGNVLRGPVYTCKGYEWPTDSGYPMVPVFQLDLRVCSQVADIDAGDGLLQIFMGHDKYMASDALIREIPRRKVNGSDLMRIPDFGNGIRPFSSIGWATASNEDQDRNNEALQIVGFAAPRFTVCHMDKLIEKIEPQDLVSLGVFPDEVAAFDQCIEDMAGKFDPSGFHLFGTFFRIQYDVTERPKVLFNLESEYGFNFGDGNAQVFLDRKGRHRYFSFDWSCF